MIKKVSRKTALAKYPVLPTANWRTEVFFYPKVFKSYLLTVESKSVKSHLKDLVEGLARLTRDMNIEHLVFLGDTKTPWLYQENDYKPVQAAKQYLMENKVSETFNGAIMVSTEELEIFTQHLLWLTRCNAALPYYHFVDEGQNIICHPCKEWNLHFDTLNGKVDKLFNKVLGSSGLVITGTCLPGWAKTNKNAGSKSAI